MTTGLNRFSRRFDGERETPVSNVRDGKINTGKSPCTAPLRNALRLISGQGMILEV